MLPLHRIRNDINKLFYIADLHPFKCHLERLVINGISKNTQHKANGGAQDEWD